MRRPSPAVVGIVLVPLVVGGLVAVALFAAPVPKKVADEDAIVGRWKLVEVQLGADGEKPRDDDTDWKTRVYEFRKDGTYTSTQKGHKPVDGTFKLDPSATPKALDVIVGDAKTPTGIVYQLDGDTLKLCVGGKRAERPTELKADAKTSTHVWVFERVKEE